MSAVCRQLGPRRRIRAALPFVAALARGRLMTRPGPGRDAIRTTTRASCGLHSKFLNREQESP
jgi:hypothetical protein